MDEARLKDFHADCADLVLDFCCDHILVGMEVGVREGNFSRFVLENTKAVLHGVDLRVSGSAKKLATEFPGRHAIKKDRSPDCAVKFPDASFDFIYVDADHSEAAVSADLRAWWPKLKPGGLFFGDDYADTDNPGEGRYGVVEAVEKWAEEMGLTPRVTGVRGGKDERLAFAKFNGEQASLYLRKKRHEPFQNPAWYFTK